MQRLKTLSKHLIDKGTIQYSEEVAKARREGDPIVALESTIISHGMPYPQNVETAKRVEDMVRSRGAVPATIAIRRGVVLVGLSPEDLEYFGKRGRSCKKVSRRDLPFVLASGLDGATTVSATSLLAVRAGISIFATGGIGGVHRGGQDSMDISADLMELGKTPICVVCAGVKSILDIPRTLEVLETQGVTVLSYQSTEFPAFFTRHSGVQSPMSVNSPEEVAQILHTSHSMQLEQGQLVAVPVPASEEANAALVQKATMEALEACHQQNIQGRDITPFLLSRIAETTKGRSLAANIALILNNARIAADVAVAFGKRVWVAGGIVQDIEIHANLKQGTSVPGTLRHEWGGVACRVATRLYGMSIPVDFVSAVGDDHALHWMQQRGWHPIRVDMPTAKCILIMKDGDLQHAVIEDDIFVSLTAPKLLATLPKHAHICLLDGNLSVSTLKDTLAVLDSRITIYEPTSVPKAHRLIASEQSVDYTTPNRAELFAMAEKTLSEDPDMIVQAARWLLFQGSVKKAVIVTDGHRGVFFVTKQTHVLIPAQTLSKPLTSTTGAGDVYVSHFIQGLLSNKSALTAAEQAQSHAERWLCSIHNVQPHA